MPTCFYCGADVMWGGDFTFEDYGIDGDGIVTNYTCSQCGTYYETYTRDRETEENTEDD